MTKISYSGAQPIRTRRRRPSRPKPQRRHRATIATTVVVLLVGVTVGLCELRVGRVEVTGAVVADPAHLESALASCFGRRLLLLDRGALTATLESDPWVAQARARPSVNGSLLVTIKEERPAFADARGQGAYSADGHWLPAREGVDLSSLPQISWSPSWPGTETGRAEAVRGLSQALNRAPWTWSSGLSSIRFEKGGSALLTTGDGVEVALGKNGWVQRLAAFAAAYPMLQPGPGDRVDLRFERQVILNPATVLGRNGG